MASDDLVQKIIDLQNQISSTLPSQYAAAKANLDKLQAELRKLASLPGLNADQYTQYLKLQQQVPQAQAAFAPIAQAYDVQEPKERDFAQHQKDLIAQMSPGVAKAYSALDTDTATWASYMGGLRRVPADQIPRAKDIHAQLRDYVGKNPNVTPGGFEAERNRLQAGQFFDPESDPRNIEQLAAAKRTWMQRTINRDNFKSHWSNGGNIAVGYAALDLAQGVAGYEELSLTGQRYTAEARQRAAYGLLPGIGGVIGAIGGSFTPLGPYGGAAIGAGIGTGIAGFKSAESQQSEALRLAATDLAAQTGRGAAAIGQFSSMLETAARTAGTPAAELANSVQSASRIVGTLNAGGISGVAGLQQQLGDRFPSVFPSALRFAQSAPLSQPYRDLIRTGQGDPSLFYGAALYEASQGDVSAAYDQLELYGTKTLSPKAAQLQARINADKTFQDQYAPYDPRGWGRNASTSKTTKDREDAERQLAKLQQSGDAYTVAPGPAKDLVDSIIRQTLQTRGLSDATGASAGAYGLYGQQALESGQGVAGLAPNVRGQVNDLLAQQTTLRQEESVLTNAFKTAPAGAQGWLNSRLGQIHLELAQNRGQIISANVGLFREGVSQTESQYGGVQQRLGVSQAAYMTGGGSVFGMGYAMNAARQAAVAQGRASYEQGLADDTTNFLSPQERQQMASQAAEQRYTAQFAIPNAWAVARVGETISGSGVRQAGLGVGVAAAGITGGVSETLRAQNDLLREQSNLRDQLNQRLREGHLTLEQSRQVQSQILDLDRQQVEGRRQAIESAFAGHGAVYGAQADSLTVQAGRQSRLVGTSAGTYAQEGAGYAMSLQQVALLKLRRDTATNPDDRALFDAQYQQAAAGTEAARIDTAGSFGMGPVFDTRFMRLSHRLSRQERSPFEPGSVLQTNSELARMDTQSLHGIQAQMDRVHNDPRLTKEEKDAAIERLAGQQEGIKDDYFSRQLSVDLGWMDRITTMSVNAPSFAPRTMPSPMSVSSIAEARGLGPMSARVFGFSRMDSYRGAAAMGMMPSDVNSLAFGKRPGDWPGAMPSDPMNVGGSGMTLGRIDSGPVGTGLPPHVVTELTEAVKGLLALLGKGLNVTVRQINPTTGQQAATTQNATGNYNSKAVQRGGAASPGDAMFAPR